MKLCAVMPCHNHADTLVDVLRGLKGYPVIVLDDGSDSKIELPKDFVNVKLLRFEKNKGKSEALKALFLEALKSGYTHAVALDADMQHSPNLVENFAIEAQKYPNAIIVGARDFENSSIPPARKFLNKFSNFWFRVETGVDVRDTQCGFRCYPLEQIMKLNLSFGGFVFEVELLVKAAWAGIDIHQIKIPAVYNNKVLAKSHYRPFVDTMKFTIMNTKLWLQSLVFSKSFLKKISIKK